jgi:hypothetical protein
MNELTLGRSHMYVSNAGKPSFIQEAFDDMCKLTQEIHLMYVSSVGRTSLILVLINYMREFTLERKPYVWKAR